MSNNKLIIVESPTKANTIRSFLGANSGYRIIASKGHIRTLPKEDMCIDLSNGYKPKYIIDPDKEEIIKTLKSELKEADELILATDGDREGESISWHLLEVLKPQVPFRRMIFHEITKKEIIYGLEHGRELDMNLVHAQEARRVLDRLYGYSVSPLLWSKLSNKTLSAGRVQSPGLRLIVDRERLRFNFRQSEFFDVKALFEGNFEARLDIYKGSKIATSQNFDSETGLYQPKKDMILLDGAKADEISKELNSSSFYVSKVQQSVKTSKPLPPFTTSTLQQDANRKLKFSSNETMRIAQNLFQKGFITYHRTDSPGLSDEGIQGARNAAAQTYGIDSVSPEIRYYGPKNDTAQEAHGAIRPVGEVFVKPEKTGLSGRELSLYTLIYKRTLACQMNDSRRTITTATIKCEGIEDTYLTASGSRLEYPGYMQVYVAEREDDGQDEKESTLPVLKEQQKLSIKNTECSAHKTKEPNRYSEATLVQKLEELGIGRPSTYASIIEKLLENEYVIRKNNVLIPTFTGFGVIQLLENYFSEITGYEFTKDMEADLDEIANGNINELQFLKSFYEGDNGLKKQIEINKGLIDSKVAKTLVLPRLSKENSVILGPYGPYVKSNDGDCVSIPKDWLPADVTDDMITDLKNGKNGRAEEKANGPVLIGNTPEGKPVFYCKGRFGDYWQIGDKSEKQEDVKRFKVPVSLIGKTVPVERILDYFALPKTIGTSESGEPIIADIGRFGAYLKCGDDYRNLKDPEEIFSTVETEARLIFSQPKSTGKSKKTSYVVKDFGDVEGNNLSIMRGKYGFYLKHGKSNHKIDSKYQQNEQACKEMTLEEALAYLKKSV